MSNLSCGSEAVLSDLTATKSAVNTVLGVGGKLGQTHLRPLLLAEGLERALPQYNTNVKQKLHQSKSN